MAEIKKWNDPAIAKDNPNVKLPDTDITVVRRADSSGTTYVFTKHLSAINEAWKKGPGTGKTVKWADSDKIVAAPKNDGITATIKQTPGAIGYIEYGYAKLAKVNMAALQNKDGKFVMPSEQNGAAALSKAEIPEDMILWGMQAATIDVGLELSPRVRDQVGVLIEKIMADLSRWGIGAHPRVETKEASDKPWNSTAETS